MKFTKFQVALQIFPDLQDKPDTAVQRMRRWILGDPELQEKLRKAKYRSKSKCLTKKQSELILRYLA